MKIRFKKGYNCYNWYKPTRCLPVVTVVVV